MEPTAVAVHPIAAKASRAYRSETSADAEQTLIEQYLPLVKTTVNRMRVTLPATLDLEDLYSVGITGLINAVRRFDPAQSATFVAFAAQHIRGAVLDELRRMDWMSRGCRDKARKVQDAIGRVEQRTLRPATEEEMCAELQVSAQEYAELLDEVQPASFLPLDGEAFTEDSDDIRLHEIIPDNSQVSAREQLERKELTQLVIERIQQLPDVPKKILAMYYFEEMRVAEIAAAFRLTEGRISQIHTQTVLGLRAFMANVLNNSPSLPCS